MYCLDYSLYQIVFLFCNVLYDVILDNMVTLVFFSIHFSLAVVLLLVQYGV